MEQIAITTTDMLIGIFRAGWSIDLDKRIFAFDPASDDDGRFIWKDEGSGTYAYVQLVIQKGSKAWCSGALMDFNKAIELFYVKYIDMKNTNTGHQYRTQEIEK